MASLILNDPLVSKSLHSHSLKHPLSIQTQFLSFPTKISPKLDSCNGFRIDGSGFGLSIKGCFGSDSDGMFQKQRTFSPNPGLALGHLEAKVEVEKDGNLVNGRQWGRPLRFPHATSPEKIVVAVDVDEVLGNFVSALNRFIADRYSLNHSVSEYHVYEFFKIWNCSRDDADLRVHEFFKTQYFKAGIHPLPGARRALDELSRFSKLSVVTSRGAKVLIDDNPRSAIECAEVGIRVLLFDYENLYPWCKTDSIHNHPLVTKVHNWEEVEQQLVSWIVSE